MSGQDASTAWTTVGPKSGRGRATPRGSVTRSGAHGSTRGSSRSPAAAMTSQHQPGIQVAATAAMQTSPTSPAEILTAPMQTSQTLSTEIQTAPMQTSRTLPTEIQTARMHTTQTSLAGIETAAAVIPQAQGPAISKRMVKRIYHRETDYKKLREEVNALKEIVIQLTKKVDELQQKDREREKEKEEQEMVKKIRLELAAAAPYYQYQPAITPIHPAVQPRLPRAHKTFAQSYNAPPPPPPESSHPSYEEDYQSITDILEVSSGSPPLPLPQYESFGFPLDVQNQPEAVSPDRCTGYVFL